ncbi:single-stranded DNA-binding protein [Herbiconiux ginsengi]|uniref:Single-stranded DNA-binding protein n=1 Tax=Herbiconiux ginsengi TaxID=381665 RepID=A0A1H3RVZ1_9MICO|nr:single-stranded DNA-binding protein [Herbiconiux ginsengi]SDZ29431.1 Single-stranded DNA-binding protein [Herbiconiux ginsengi]
MPDHLTLTGVVATSPRHITTNSGLDITSFRLASGQRRFDREQKKWVDAETNWYTVTTFRQLALNVVGSVERGQHVVVTGRLRVRAWENGDKSGTTIELEAEAAGHDLSWGTSAYTKTVFAGSSGDAAATPGGGFIPPETPSGPGLAQVGWAPPLSGGGGPDASAGSSGSPGADAAAEDSAAAAETAAAEDTEADVKAEPGGLLLPF